MDEKAGAVIDILADEVVNGLVDGAGEVTNKWAEMLKEDQEKGHKGAPGEVVDNEPPPPDEQETQLEELEAKQ